MAGEETPIDAIAAPLRSRSGAATHQTSSRHSPESMAYPSVLTRAHALANSASDTLVFAVNLSRGVVP